MDQKLICVPFSKVNQSLLNAEEFCPSIIIVEKLGMLFFTWQEDRGYFPTLGSNFQNYIDWNYRNIQETIERELGWESPEESEHMDCVIHPIQNYIHMRRFPEIELDRLKFAKLIMVGQMTREKALYKLQSSKTQDSKPALDRFLKDIKMTKEEFDKYIDMGPRHLQYYAPTLMEKLVKFSIPKYHS